VSGSRSVERCVEPRTGARVVSFSRRLCFRRHVSYHTPFRPSFRHAVTCTVSDRPTSTTACPSAAAAADADDNECRRHGDGDGVRSDNDDANRSPRTRGKRVLVRRYRPTRALKTLQPLISTFYSDQTTGARCCTHANYRLERQRRHVLFTDTGERQCELSEILSYFLLFVEKNLLTLSYLSEPYSVFYKTEKF